MAPDLAPGTAVGPYLVEALLGRGGMGVVYSATDARLERRIALKVVAKSDGDDREGYEGRFVREARAVAALNHPNVVAIFDVGETPELLYFAMEYVDGQNLRAKIGARDVSLEERLRWLTDVARALHAAHQAGVVHRDVKPENVMIRADGLVKVLDFGIARRTVAIAPGVEHVTGDDHVTGTPLYMAPEQLRGEALDARSDQFAWGIVAYELLSGVRPFSDATEGYALVASILTDIATPLRERAPDVPEQVAIVVHTALAKAPERRLPSMGEVASELAAHGGQRSTRPTSWSGAQAVIDGQRHEPAAFAETTRVPTTQDASARAPEVPPRSRRKMAIGLGISVVLAFVAALVVSRRPRPARPLPERALCAVPEAHAELKAARVHLRDGAESEAVRELRRAVELDDECGAAHLELALRLAPHDPQEGLRHYRSAFHTRERLTGRDLAVLDASEPFVRARPDLAEWETRLTGAVYQHPKDAELRVWLGTARARQLDLEGAKAAFEAATRLDVGYAPAWAGLASVEHRLGDRTAALGAVAACLERSPVASVCLGTRYELRATAGECSQARDDAMAWTGLDPSSPDPQRALAAALFAVDAPRPAVEAALLRRWTLLPPPERHLETLDRLDLAIVDGRFGEGLALADTLERALPPDADLTEHAAVAMTRVTLLTETGDPKGAGGVAKSFRDRMLAYAPNRLAPDPSIGFIEPMFRAGILSSADLERLRATWQADEIVRTRATDPGVLSQQRARLAWLRWALVYGSFAETREEAVAAKALMPTISEPPLAQRSLRFDFAAGKVLALSGDTSHAVDHLRRVTDACFGLSEPQLRVRAHYYLGLAMEGSGDKAGAAKAYRFVVTQWGDARPRSVTAEKAKARLSAMGGRAKE